MKLSLIAFAFAAITMAGCGDTNPKDNSKNEADTLAKMENTLDATPITEKYWKLVTLEGQKVTMAQNQEREMYFMLKKDQNQVRGFAGCNTFNGTYIMENG